MKDKIRSELVLLQDDKYKEFQSKLCPNVNNMIGVRLPLLRKIAKKISKGDWKTFIESIDNKYFEEVMLQGMVIGYLNIDIDELINYITEFIPKIDNWSICDSFCCGLKFINNNKSFMWRYIQVYLKSHKEFEIRFAIVILINFYIEKDYINKIMSILDNIDTSQYYSSMAVAWLISICYVEFPNITMEYLKCSKLNDFVYNKSIQKIMESTRINLEIKKSISKLKRK